jgi:hypothetical protein
MATDIIRPPVAGESALIAVLARIVIEAMEHPPVRPSSTDSYLPPELVADAQAVLHRVGASVTPVSGQGRG